MMTRILFATVVLILFSKPEISFANTTLKLICDVHTFETRNQYLSKDLGHDLNLKPRFFQLEFNSSYQKLETDMIMVVDTTIIEFSDKDSILELTTAVDTIGFYYLFEVNRITGRVKQVRVDSKDPNNIEAYEYECRSAKRKF